MTAGYDFVTLCRMANQQRSMSNGHGFSFSNGNAGPDEDPWSGNPIRPVHWWLLA